MEDDFVLKIRKYKGGGRPKGSYSRVQPLEIIRIYEFKNNGEVVRIAEVTRALNPNLDINEDECLKYRVSKCSLEKSFCTDRAIEENIQAFVCTECPMYDKKHKLPLNTKITKFKSSSQQR
jgi:hypothetical protein